MIRKLQDEDIFKIYNENFCKDFHKNQRKDIDINKFTYLIKIYGMGYYILKMMK